MGMQGGSRVKDFHELKIWQKAHARLIQKLNADR